MDVAEDAECWQALYPLSKKNNPPTMNFVNISGEFDNTIHRMDFGYWQELNATIQAEPLEGLDPETRGLLAAIGIKKGYAPDKPAISGTRQQQKGSKTERRRFV